MSLYELKCLGACVIVPALEDAVFEDIEHNLFVLFEDELKGSAAGIVGDAISIESGTVLDAIEWDVVEGEVVKALPQDESSDEVADLSGEGELVEDVEWILVKVDFDDPIRSDIESEAVKEYVTALRQRLLDVILNRVDLERYKLCSDTHFEGSIIGFLD